MGSGKKSPLVLKKNLIANPCTIKTFLKTKLRSYGDEAIYFNDKEIPKACSNYTCLAAVLIYFVLKKDENYYL